VKRIALIVLAAGVLFVACDNDGDSAQSAETSETPFVLGSPHQEGAPEFKVGTVLIDGAEEGPVLLDAEVADTEETRAYGLTAREFVPDDYGMVFILFEEQDCCFWMKDTIVPISIAFFDTDGHIVDIVDMQPCKAPGDNCKLYSSRRPYVGALEVKQGLFDEWGVSIGDRIRVVQ
jgi:uncharacterized membrane protein (UPF0127 family)